MISLLYGLFLNNPKRITKNMKKSSNKKPPRRRLFIKHQLL